jgi:hypothetical protein
MVGSPVTKVRVGLTVKLAVLVDESQLIAVEVIQLVAPLSQCATRRLGKKRVQNL